MKPNHDDLTQEEIISRKIELAYQTFYLVVLQACEDLRKKLADYAKDLSLLR